MPSNLEKMRAGDWYTCMDAELGALRDKARAACHAHRVMPVAERGAMAPDLRAILSSVAEDVFIEAPFHCAYGFNIHLGAAVYLNANCVILDTGPVHIGAGSMFGPSVQIYCADHHRDRALRAQGMERARPVTIGKDVWIGGQAVILPGTTIGDGAIIGAGAVVTRDVAPESRVAGNPARPLDGS
ncbi:MAG: sugar O-acetyltransferase [Pseudomonadota bacterium]